MYEWFVLAHTRLVGHGFSSAAFFCRVIAMASTCNFDDLYSVSLGHAV